VEYVQGMQFFESQRDVDERAPNGVFLEHGLLLLMLHYFLVEVSVIGELHDDAEWSVPYQSELD